MLIHSSLTFPLWRLTIVYLQISPSSSVKHLASGEKICSEVVKSRARKLIVVSDVPHFRGMSHEYFSCWYKHEGSVSVEGDQLKWAKPRLTQREIPKRAVSKQKRGWICVPTCPMLSPNTECTTIDACKLCVYCHCTEPRQQYCGSYVDWFCIHVCIRANRTEQNAPLERNYL